jgi:XTP/dITP diphosphohydrolase
MLPPELARPLLVGTSNLGKLDEISRFASRLGFAVIGLADPQLVALGPAPEVPEVADTYSGNALLKAESYAKHFNRPCLADDTGLEIPMLGDLPGIHTARWGLARVIEEIGIFRRLPARFVCAMAYADPSGRSIVTHGTIEGELRDMIVPRGTSKPLPFGDFFHPLGGSDPIGKLVREGFEGSHRFQALAALVRALS